MCQTQYMYMYVYVYVYLFIYLSIYLWLTELQYSSLAQTIADILEQHDDSQHPAAEVLWVETSKTLPQGAQKGALEGFFARTCMLFMDIHRPMGFI